jgi:cobalamin biosynthesis Mg chelatase CobN
MALLALSFLPALAQAESSAGLEYQDAPPTVPGHTAANDKESTAHKADAAGGGSGSTGGGSAKDGSSDRSGGGTATGDQQGSQGDRNGKGSGNPEKVSHGGATAPASEDESGSSPLVPILIAIAVLAAISIGVVVMRQRRRDDSSAGSPVSPEAG